MLGRGFTELEIYGNSKSDVILNKNVGGIAGGNAGEMMELLDSHCGDHSFRIAKSRCENLIHDVIHE